MFTFLAPLLLKLSPVGSFMKAIPPKAWYAIGIIAALFAAYLWHGHEMKKHDTAIIAANNAQWQTRLNAAAAAIKAKDAEIAVMSAQIRKANDEENARIAAAAGVIRVRGPGAAACPSVSSAASAPRGPLAPSGSGDAPVDPVPSAGGQQLIALPFDDTLDFGQDHDSYLTEVLSWHTWYAKLVAAWPKQPAPSR